MTTPAPHPSWPPPASPPPTRRAARAKPGRTANWRYRIATKAHSEPAARRLRTVRASLWRQRYLLAAVWVIALAWFVVRALAPVPTGTAILVAGEAIAAGEAVSANQVRSVMVPKEAIPSDALTDAHALPSGATRIPLTSGMPLATSMFTSAHLQQQLPAGFVAMPVLLDAGVCAIAESGSWISLYGANETGSTLVAQRALLLQLAEPADDALDITGAERYINAVVAIDQQRATVLLDALAIAPLRAVLPAS